MERKTVILALGNLLMGDEGIGIHLIRQMGYMESKGIKLIDGGTALPESLPCLQDTEKLIVIDTVMGGGRPGTVYKFDLEEAEFQKPNSMLSVHQISFLQHLFFFGEKPKKTVVIGIEPGKLEPKIGLSSAIKKRVPKILSLIENESLR